ncbi:MAG: redoxin domain-containing protein [Cyclobacteriaceae bacterium]|nr:redoxin domain-containing protein [Cyclobacteriaceae bacterium SS2]
MKRFGYLFICLVSFSLFAQEKKVEKLPIGATAPPFDLPGVDGKNYTLDNFSDKDYLVVMFICNHCPTAQAYEKKIIDLVASYSPRGIGFVAISPNDPDAISLSELGYTDMSDNLEEMKLRAKHLNYNFPYLYDGDNQQVSITYGPSATPHVFLFDKTRKLVYSGRIDDTENPYVTPKTTDLKNALDAALSGKPIQTPETKTFGCSIKWSWKGDWVGKLAAQWAREEVTLEEINLAGVGDLVKNKPGEKLRLINFWATWCGPCVIEFPEFVDINRMYRDRDFEFISVSADKLNRKEKALEFLKKKEASSQNYIFSGKSIYDLIEVVDPDWQGALPYTLLVNKEGKVVYKIDGTIDPQLIKTKIVEQLGRYYADN